MSDRDETEETHLPSKSRSMPPHETEAESVDVKLPPIHWCLPLLAFGYVPMTLALAERMGPGLETYMMLVNSAYALFFILPLYVLVIFGLRAQRVKQGINDNGLTLLGILSMVPSVLYLLFWLTNTASPV